MMNDELEQYLLSHIDPEPEYLHRLWRATHLHLNYPRMASGHLQGRLLKMLTHMIRPKTVLEIGTFTGYSTLCMASALEAGATIHTIEINDEQEDFTRPWLENSPWADKIHFYIGDALHLLNAEMNDDATAKHQMVNGKWLNSKWIDGKWLNSKCFDLVFIDADKRHYVDYYRAVLPLVQPGGFILADNTLWDGHVIDAQSQAHNGKEAQTRGIMAFNDLVATDPAVERVILPLRDGLTLIRKLP